MALDKKISDNLNKLKHYKGKAGWKNFFKAVNRLKELEGEINDEMHETPSNTSALDKEASKLVNSLENKKDNVAKKTSDKNEYDAVHNIISDLSDEFAGSK